MTNPIPLHVAVAGFSGSGKTTLLEALLPRLREEGMKVGYLKPHAHRIDLDKSGKDTERMRRAGAAAVAIHGPGGAIHFPEPGWWPQGRTTGGAEHLGESLPVSDHQVRAFLWSLRGLYGRCEIVLIEGMKDSHLPKILVNREDNPRGIVPPESLREVILHARWGLHPPSVTAYEPEAAERVLALHHAPRREAARDVLGVVLAGGRSSRMGADKARLPVADGCGTWLERAVLLLADHCADVMVAGRLPESDGADLPLLRYPVTGHLDLRPGCGTLGGMETALRLACGRAVLVVPCDLPELDPTALAHLLESRDRAAPATVFRGPGGLEPAVALLEPRLLGPLRAFLDAGSRRAREFLESVGAREVPIPMDLLAGFANRNTPSEFVDYMRRARGSDRLGS